MRRRTRIQTFGVTVGALALAWSCGGGTSTSVIGPSDTRCTISVSGSDAPVSASSTSGSLTVSTGRECAWSATSEVEWITITAGSSGRGNGRVDYTVASNSGAETRRGAIAIGERQVEVVQAGAPCTFTLSSTEASVGAAGGDATVSVRATRGCEWTATSRDAWIAVSSGGSGAGDGTVRLRVEANAGAPRTGTVTIADHVYTISQQAECSGYELSVTSWHVPAGGGSGAVDVGTQPWCEWSATTGDSWIGIASGGRGTGSGTVTLAVDANAGAPRSGVVTIAGHSFAVSQDATCTYSLSRETQGVTLLGGSFIVDVFTQPWCPWTAISHDDWIRIVTGASGMGSGTVGYRVSSRFLPVTRTGTLTIAGQTLRVRQSPF